MRRSEIDSAMSDRLSVVIPTHGRGASVKRLLRALLRQTLSPAEYEVIVVVDGTPVIDGTPSMTGAPESMWQPLADLGASHALRIVEQPHRGRAAACNTGLRAATGSRVVLLDDDMEPAPDYLAAHQRAHMAETRVGVLGAVPIETDRSSTPVMRYVAAKFDQHLERLARHGGPVTVRDFYSGNFSIRRDVLLEVGGFDESFDRYGNEDLELAVRLTRAGVRLKYEPAARARQHYEKDFAALARDNYTKGQTAIQLAAKHPHVYGQLKLSTYHQASPGWRTARLGLLALSSWWTPTPAAMLRMVHLLEYLPGARLDPLYRFVTDYFFWLGAREAKARASNHPEAKPLSEGQ